MERFNLTFFRDKFFVLLLVMIWLFISLFPPFSWGDERLTTERGRKEIYNKTLAENILPIKQYDFIFNSNKKEFSFGWNWVANPREYLGWDYDEQSAKYKENTGGKSVEIKATLSRHLIISELILNYMLGFLISFLISFFFTALNKSKH